MQTAESPAANPAEPAAEPAEIKTRDLTKNYPGDILAVDKLSLDIHRGEFFGLPPVTI